MVYSGHLGKIADKLDVTPVAFTNDVAEMADYVRGPRSRAEIEGGLRDIQEGRTIEGRGALAAELTRRAETRRRD